MDQVLSSLVTAVRGEALAKLPNSLENVQLIIAFVLFPGLLTAALPHQERPARLISFKNMTPLLKNLDFVKN